MRATTSTPEPAGKPISTVIVGLNMRAFSMECLRRRGELAAMLRH